MPKVKRKRPLVSASKRRGPNNDLIQSLADAERAFHEEKVVIVEKLALQLARSREAGTITEPEVHAIAGWVDEAAVISTMYRLAQAGHVYISGFDPEDGEPLFTPVEVW